MIHDEKTTELELPKKQEPTQTIASAMVVPDGVAPIGRDEERTQEDPQWFRDLDWNSPWVLRLVAVIAILVLSMIIL